MESISRLNEEEQKSLLTRDSELLSHLLTDLKSSSEEIREKLCPILEEASKIDPGSAHPFFKMKYQLLINYCTNLSYYLYLRSKGENLEEHPVINQLLEIRVYLEKIRPLEKRMRTKLVAALKMPETTQNNTEDEEALFSDDDEEIITTKKLTYFENEETPLEMPDAKADAKAKKAKSLLAKHKIAAEIYAESHDLPEEINGEAIDNEDDSEFEGEMFRRVKTSKKTLQRKSDFNDEFADIGDFDELLADANVEIAQKVRKTDFIENDEIPSEETEVEDNASEESEKPQKPTKQHTPREDRNVTRVYVKGDEEFTEGNRKVTEEIEKNKFMTKKTGKKASGRIQLKTKFNREEKNWVKKRRDGAGNYSGESAIRSDARGSKL